jgi:hypothetical protein
MVSFLFTEPIRHFNERNVQPMVYIYIKETKKKGGQYKKAQTKNIQIYNSLFWMLPKELSWTTWKIYRENLRLEVRNHDWYKTYSHCHQRSVGPHKLTQISCYELLRRLYYIVKMIVGQTEFRLWFCKLRHYAIIYVMTRRSFVRCYQRY